jgi:hypothetical protein
MAMSQDHGYDMFCRHMRMAVGQIFGAVKIDDKLFIYLYLNIRRSHAFAATDVVSLNLTNQASRQYEKDIFFINIHI